ncbi:hypothetical protein P8625_06960 [Tenacibaculum tangerinum]|uniref:Uncharacterized protein n=1 Tax=Tenacibaculum tangerinum TaxID=3038772 RepID=A0ABY8L730_9FLAO|nr:hypothetical protein [Tenacibaculum tangerinum]WGH76876.1 hypothetical protein P8625_06960 [Tenacibaculum tangerinum]
MKKSILNLGKALNKAEQENINGGWVYAPGDGKSCDFWGWCENEFGRCHYCGV